MSQQVFLLQYLKRVLLVTGLAVYAESIYGATLQEQLEQAIQDFSEANYAATYWQFEAMELDYGQEPEFLNRNFQQTILPVRAYAALMADRPTDALVYFGKLLSNHAVQPGLHGFALYHAAIAQSQTGSYAAAALTFNNFRLSFPKSREAWLALLQQADLLAESGQQQEAQMLLDELFSSEAPTNLRMQGRLRGLQIASEAGQTDRAKEILFETRWDISAMPDIAILSFAALDAGDLLLQQMLPADAIRAYRLVLPHNYLIEKQTERISRASQGLQQQRLSSSIWNSHCQQLIQRLQRQLERLKTMSDYTPSLYLRKGQAYLLAKRHREAALLFSDIATNHNYENNLRAEAHYRWILAVSDAQQWRTARKIANDFLKQHPSHALANQALFLIARAYQSEGLYAEAIEVLDTLINNFPDDKQAPRWYFTRGYNYCALENQIVARESFDTSLQKFPNSKLAAQTELWRGLTFFFERNYHASLDALISLQKKSKGHPLLPEIKYRIANVYYALRDYHAALKTTGELLENHSDHHRAAEAQALRGDIYMGLGELNQAAHAFQQVSDDQAQIFDYAVFQTTKIYKALERYDLMQDHLETYVHRSDATKRPRVSEALYWIGWSLTQQNRTADAFPIFEQALERFGNDTEAAAVSSILSAFARLYEDYQPHSTENQQDFNTCCLLYTSDAADE